MGQFPQPTRPVQSYDLAPTQLPQPSEPVNIKNRSSCSLDFADNSIPQPTISEEENQSVEDLIRVISECYEKLPECIRSQVNLEIFNVPSSNNTTEQGFQVESTTTTTIRGHNDHLLEEFKHKLERLKIRTVDINTSRGVNGPAQELRQKLERFKIRTVQVGGEVSGEEVKR